MKTMLTYQGHPVREYSYSFFYSIDDYVIYNEKLYRSLYSNNFRHIPESSSFFWEEIGCLNKKINDNRQKKENVTIKVSGDRIGNIKADNAVVYGNNTGNIIANGEKSVVVVFGDVVGNIEADQVIHVHDVDKTKIKEALAHVKDRRF